MTTIIDSVKRLEKKVDKINPDKIKDQVKEEVIHENLMERFRGKKWNEKLEAIFTIVAA